MPSIGTLALRRSNSPSPPATVPSPITVPKRVWPKPTATTAFAYEPRPSTSSTTSSFSSSSPPFGSPSSPIGTKTLKKQSSWTSRSSTSSATANQRLRTTVVHIPDAGAKRSIDGESAPSPGGYDKWGGFSFDFAHSSPKGFYVQSIAEFLGDGMPVGNKR
ncbi:hypothetical protein MPH_08528 [Macrophomina phaseolina MS6]|uniref:Uncharacterized protein n=1 Tax=Macrophomina phaseolina (strain MS6) TaxID=1126212 RepID=K2RN92_MACPH|nr:hypothetical protein MPH_08528 [Macrophomina phaseolina MS6]